MRRFRCPERHQTDNACYYRPDWRDGIARFLRQAGFDLLYCGNFVDLGLCDAQATVDAQHWIFPGEMAARSMQRTAERAPLRCRSSHSQTGREANPDSRMRTALTQVAPQSRRSAGSCMRGSCGEYLEAERVPAYRYERRPTPQRP